MAPPPVSLCLRCLHRRTLRLSPVLPLASTTSTATAQPLQQRTSPLSTTSSLGAAKKAQAGKAGPPKRGSRSLKLGKSRREKASAHPMPGERRELKKRIVLSNTNAFEVVGLPEWNVEDRPWQKRSSEEASDAAGRGLLGQVVSLPGEVVDQLRAIEAFRVGQGWGWFRRPCCLVREPSGELSKHIAVAGDKKQRRSLIIDGEKSTGKSVLALQAMAMAFMKGWIVIHIPEAQDLTIAHTAYAPLPNTSSPTLYSQKDYTAAFLSRIAKANNKVLSSLSLSLSHETAFPLQSNISLLRLCETGARDPDLAWPIYQILFRELTAPSTGNHPRPPILYSLDGLAHISRPSEYLAPSMNFIHAHDLAIVNHFVGFLSPGRNTSSLAGEGAAMPNGGLVLAVDSRSNRPSTASLDLALRTRSQLASGALTQEQYDALPMYDLENPWEGIDVQSYAALRGVEVVRTERFSREEAKTILEYYARSGMLRRRVNEGMVAEAWAVSGGGVVGELERGTVRSGLL